MSQVLQINIIIIVGSTQQEHDQASMSEHAWNDKEEQCRPQLNKASIQAQKC